MPARRPSPRRHRGPALAAGGLLSAVALVAAGLPATAASTPSAPHLPLLDGAGQALDSVLDVRDVKAAVVPTTAQRQAASALLKASGAGARVTWDERFGTPRSLRRDGGYLTAARAGSAQTVARG